MKIDFKDGSTYTASKFKDPYLYFFLVGGAEAILRLEGLVLNVALPPRKEREILHLEIFGVLLQHLQSKRIKKMV